MKQSHGSSVSIERLITRIGPEGRREVADVLLREERFDLYCNGRNVAELHCMPSHLRELAAGRLVTLGLLHDVTQISSINIDPSRKCIEADIAAPKSSPQRPDADVRLSAEQVHALQQSFEKRCDLFRQTGAAHSCSLANPEELLLFYEDIARHNALDKLIGAMLLQGVGPQGKIMIFSGRLASDMLAKAIVSGVRLLIAPGAPSFTSVEMAEANGITLLGFVRRDNINIYTCPQRVG